MLDIVFIFLVSLPVHATRHSLLRPTNFEIDSQGRKRSASGIFCNLGLIS